ncbi:hypothetical protein AXG89_30945 (plasmid) [Burkholderia sp. PAMC 26561]|nr:hypothetical protein AXG89_30945 [Burkholderia sp. PAMC 26561]
MSADGKNVNLRALKQQSYCNHAVVKLGTPVFLTWQVYGTSRDWSPAIFVSFVALAAGLTLVRSAHAA